MKFTLITYSVIFLLSFVYLYGYAREKGKREGKPKNFIECTWAAGVLSALWPIFYLFVLLATLYGKGQSLAKTDERVAELEELVKRTKARADALDGRVSKLNHD